ncbi:uncharacterized protein LOC116287030 [Actinia tenebrosa]|uniref:Uncharacterized protein LOC116287030 n=1 Tax=Actinia tenebrosa TaxID=6105 RepID=A0A6P8H9V6_ACTTE|nr:uncharacterized protein LOC116287030 [Actinia tenebrosa]
MFASGYTDDSTLPSSTLDSDTDSSTQSFSSSNESLDQSLIYFNQSWPLSRDKTASLDQLSCKVNSYSWWSDLKTVSRNGSNASTPRTRPDASTPRTRPGQTAARGCSPDASALYSNPTKHYNPSVSGQHACQEMSDYREWANTYLQYSPHNTLITDLSRDLADGETLLYLVQVLLGVTLYPVHIKPALDVQKIENTQICLDVLARHGIPVSHLSAEDIVEANPKVTLVLCKHLEQHFGSNPGSPQGTSDLMTGISRRTPSPRTKQRSKSPTVTLPVGGHDTPSPPATSSHPVMDIEDVALLDWVGQMTGQIVADYNSLQDGHILCLLINRLTDGAIPDVVLEYGLPSEKVSLALMFSEDELGVTSDLCPDDVVKLNDASKMSSFFKTLHQVFLEQVQDKEHHLKIKKMNKLDRNSREIMTQEKEVNIELVRKADIVPRNFSEVETLKESGRYSDPSILNPCIRKGEEGSSILNADKMSPRSSSLAKVRSKRREILKERNCSGENRFSSYLQDSTDKRPRDNRFSYYTEDTSYRLEDLSNMDNSYRSSSSTSLHHPYHSVDVSLKNSRNKSSPHRKIDDVPCFDEDLMYGLLPKDTVFDSDDWTYSYTMPHASKSWQKERGNAQHQVRDFRNELQRLKEEYFRLMNMKALETFSQDSFTKTEKPFPPKVFVSEEDSGILNIDNVDCSSVDKKANKCTILTEKLVKRSSQTSSSVMAYMNVKKGTSPPYRTWSKYENTDGDRYRYCSTKKTLKTDRNTTRNDAITTKVAHLAEVAVRSWNGMESMKTSVECRGKGQTDDVKQVISDSNSLVSSPKKETQESLDKDDGPRRVSSQKFSGRQLYGMTALVRLSSKKANAVSDTDS